MILFFKGLKNSYNIDSHGRGIYFATDTTEILVNGVSYGLSTSTRNELYYAINSVVAGVNFTLPGKFEFIDGNNNIINTIELTTATQKQSGLLSAEDKKALDDLVLGRFYIKTDDAILALNENKELFTSISLSYNNNKIQLFGKDSVISEIDASDFIKDGMLSGASIVTNPEGLATGTYLKLLFNIDSEKEPIYVDISKLIDNFDGSNIYLSGYNALLSDATPITKEDSLNLAIAKLAKLIEENEFISAKAFTELNNRIISGDAEILQLSKDYTDVALSWILV